MEDVSNIYTYKGSFTNPGAGPKTVVQFEASQYKPLTVLKVELSCRGLVDEMCNLAIAKKTAAATLPSTPAFRTEICPLDEKQGDAIDPGFRAATNTKYGAASDEGTTGATVWQQSFHTKIGALWLPAYDPETQKFKPININYGEIYALIFPITPTSSQTWDFVVTLKEG